MDFFTVLWSFYERNDIQDAKLEAHKFKSTQTINPLEASKEAHTVHLSGLVVAAPKMQNKLLFFFIIFMNNGSDNNAIYIQHTAQQPLPVCPMGLAAHIRHSNLIVFVLILFILISAV